MEILLVIGIIGILLVITVLPFTTFRNSRALTQSTETLIAVLNDARTKTLASINGDQYGVALLSDRAVLFVGSVYDANATTNQSFFFESPVTLGTISLAGGGSSVLFKKLTGATDTYGTIVLQMSGGEITTLTVLASGIINKQ